MFNAELQNVMYENQFSLYHEYMYIQSMFTYSNIYTKYIMYYVQSIEKKNTVSYVKVFYMYRNFKVNSYSNIYFHIVKFLKLYIYTLKDPYFKYK